MARELTLNGLRRYAYGLDDDEWLTIWRYSYEEGHLVSEDIQAEDVDAYIDQLTAEAEEHDADPEEITVEVQG